MSLFGSLSFSKSKGSTTSDSTGTFNRQTSYTSPEWMSTPFQSLFGKVDALGNNPDPASLVAGPSDLERQGWNISAGLTPQPWNQDNAVGWTNDVATSGAPRVSAASLLDGLQHYYNPYDQQVIQSSAADFDANAAQTRAQQTLANAGARSFGGYDSGAILGNALTEGELSRARGSLLSGLRQQGFNTATGLSNMDAARRQEADMANAQLMQQQNAQKLAAANQVQSLVNGYDANNRANVGTMADLGGLFRGIDQAKLTAPQDLAAWQIAQLTGLPLELFTTQNESGTETQHQTGTSKGSQLGAAIGFGYGSTGKGG